MEHAIDPLIHVCLDRHQRFASIAEARAAFREIGGLTLDQSNQVAERLSQNSGVIWGLHFACCDACMAFDWLEYHNYPMNQAAFKKLRAEFAHCDAKHDVLGWHLQFGAWMSLKNIDWKSLPNK